MAEILWILLLFQSNIGPAKKRENVRQVWSWSGIELPEGHPMLLDPVLKGLGSAGTAYITRRWRELTFLIGALRDFKQRNHAERELLLNDGWAFSAWLSGMPEGAKRQLRHILPHLLFPDHFERISSTRDKRAILATFTETPPKNLREWDLTAIDKALLDLRHGFEEERGSDVDFYNEEYTTDWREGIRSWLLSWNPLKWEWTSLSEDRAKTLSGQPVAHSWRCNSTSPREGDHVYLVRTGVPPKGIVAFGTVTRTSYVTPHYDDAEAEAGEAGRFIDVDFSEIRDVAEDQILPLDLLERDAGEQTWNPRASGIEIKPKAARILAGLWNASPNAPVAAQRSETKSAQTADVTEPLNLILYGPPGTGKTYRLQQHHIPRYTNEDGDRFEFVTFHQSYAYEDFVEGIRPVTINGSVTYEVRPGVLRRLCERARKDPRHRYAIFIDEVNRGNVAKVFGELITLIEGDKRLRYDENGTKLSGVEVTLPYSGERFGVPANVDLICTMNTADRSIALLDTALRRRFEFEEMMARPGMIRGTKDGIIADLEGGEIDLRRLLDVLNVRLTHLLHRDQTIGHAYFTKVRNFSDLRRVIAREIVPLLQEYFYDDWRQIRLVLADNSVAPEYQIVRQRVAPDEAVFPGTDAVSLGEGHLFEVTPEPDISADAIRKIYDTR